MPDLPGGGVEPHESHEPLWHGEREGPHEGMPWTSSQVGLPVATAGRDSQLKDLKAELTAARAVLGDLEAESESAAEEAVTAEGVYTAAATARSDHDAALKVARDRLQELSQPAFTGASGLAMQREITAIDQRITAAEAVAAEAYEQLSSLTPVAPIWDVSGSRYAPVFADSSKELSASEAAVAAHLLRLSRMDMAEALSAAGSGIEGYQNAVAILEARLRQKKGTNAPGASPEEEQVPDDSHPSLAIDLGASGEGPSLDAGQDVSDASSSMSNLSDLLESPQSAPRVPLALVARPAGRQHTSDSASDTSDSSSYSNDGVPPIDLRSVARRAAEVATACALHAETALNTCRKRAPLLVAYGEAIRDMSNHRAASARAQTKAAEATQRDSRRIADRRALEAEIKTLELRERKSESVEQSMKEMYDGAKAAYNVVFAKYRVARATVQDLEAKVAARMEALSAIAERIRVQSLEARASARSATAAMAAGGGPRRVLGGGSATRDSSPPGLPSPVRSTPSRGTPAASHYDRFPRLVEAKSQASAARVARERSRANELHDSGSAVPSLHGTPPSSGSQRTCVISTCMRPPYPGGVACTLGHAAQYAVNQLPLPLQVPDRQAVRATGICGFPGCFNHVPPPDEQGQHHDGCGRVHSVAIDLIEAELDRDDSFRCLPAGTSRGWGTLPSFPRGDSEFASGRGGATAGIMPNLEVSLRIRNLSSPQFFALWHEGDEAGAHGFNGVTDDQSLLAQVLAAPGAKLQVFSSPHDAAEHVKRMLDPVDAITSGGGVGTLSAGGSFGPSGGLSFTYNAKYEIGRDGFPTRGMKSGAIDEKELQTWVKRGCSDRFNVHPRAMERYMQMLGEWMEEICDVLLAGDHRLKMEAYASGDGFAKWHGILELMQPRSDEAARIARTRVENFTHDEHGLEHFTEAMDRLDEEQEA